MVRLIATDLDGTFLADHDTVSAINLAAARAAIASGIRFVVATGRPARWLAPLAAFAPLEPVVVASNGACILDRGRVVWTHPIEAPVIDEVAADLRHALPGIAFALEYGDSWAYEPGYGRESGHDPADVIGPLEDLDHAGVLKLLAWHSDVPTDELAVLAHPIVDQRLTSTFSFGSVAGLIELSAHGVTKATALSVLLDRWGIAAEDMAAFGDMPNDLDMLRLAGRGFVPANAHQSLIAEGFEVVGRHDEDGVGQAIERLLRETS